MLRISRFIRTNRLYIFLFLFIFAINFAGWMALRNEKSQKTAEEAAIEKEKQPSFEENLQIRQERVQKLAFEDPILYIFIVALNLLIFFLILLGVIFDVFLLRSLLRKKALLKLRGPTPEDPCSLCKMIENGTKDELTEPAKWNIPDVFRVTLIFLTFGYLLMILESLLSRKFPILNNQNFRMIIGTALMNVIGISVIVRFVRKKYNQPLNVIGLTAKNSLKNVSYAFFGYVATIPLLLGVMLATYFVVKFLKYTPPVQPIVEVFMAEKNASVLFVSTVFAAVFGPVAEEIYFRGFMYNAVKGKFGVFWAVMSTSLIFSVLHAHLVGVLPIFILGALLAYVYEKTGTLVAPIAMHIAHNVGMVMLVFVARYLSG